MEDLLAYVRNEASHPVFQWIWNINRETRALDGKMCAMKTLLEVSPLFLSALISLTIEKGRIEMEKES